MDEPAHIQFLIVGAANIAAMIVGTFEDEGRPVVYYCNNRTACMEVQRCTSAHTDAAPMIMHGLLKKDRVALLMRHIRDIAAARGYDRCNIHFSDNLLSVELLND